MTQRQKPGFSQEVSGAMGQADKKTRGLALKDPKAEHLLVAKREIVKIIINPVLAKLDAQYIGTPFDVLGGSRKGYPTYPRDAHELYATLGSCATGFTSNLGMSGKDSQEAADWAVKHIIFISTNLPHLLSTLNDFLRDYETHVIKLILRSEPEWYNYKFSPSHEIQLSGKHIWCLSDGLRLEESRRIEIRENLLQRVLERKKSPGSTLLTEQFRTFVNSLVRGVLDKFEKYEHLQLGVKQDVLGLDTPESR